MHTCFQSNEGALQHAYMRRSEDSLELGRRGIGQEQHFAYRLPCEEGAECQRCLLQGEPAEHKIEHASDRVQHGGLL